MTLMYRAETVRRRFRNCSLFCSCMTCLVVLENEDRNNIARSLVLGSLAGVISSSRVFGFSFKIHIYCKITSKSMQKQLLVVRDPRPVVSIVFPNTLLVG